MNSRSIDHSANQVILKHGTRYTRLFMCIHQWSVSITSTSFGHLQRIPTTVDMKLHSVSVLIVVLLIIIATWMAFEKVGNALRLTPQRCWIMTVNRRRLSRFLGWTVSYLFFPFYQRFAESRKDKTARFHRHRDSTPRTDVSYSEFLSQLPWKINLWRDKKVNKRR